MPRPSTELLRLFQKHLPENAISYCVQLWEESPFYFFVKPPRNTKLGDFRYRKDRSIQTITLNSDLNPFQFLLTFIHEVAHLRAFDRFGTTHSPHGSEWKTLFKQLLEPLLVESVFPRDILVPLKLQLMLLLLLRLKPLLLLLKLIQSERLIQSLLLQRSNQHQA